MEKKQMTGIICVPTINNPINVFDALSKISGMLGHFNCTTADNIALIKYNGAISSEHKNKLEEIVEPYGITLIYVEMYDDDDRATSNTINLIDNEEA